MKYIKSLNKLAKVILNIFIVPFLLSLCVASCQQKIQNNLTAYHEEIEILTEQLIYGKDETERLAALEDLTNIGYEVRYSALSRLIKAADNNPDLFPMEESGDNNSLLTAIITLPSHRNEQLKKKELIENRISHVKFLNQILLVTMRYRMYHEMAVILCQKYTYGTLWAQESLTIHKNKAAATEFTHARNGARANLRLLLSITSDEAIINLIHNCLKNNEENGD